MAHYSTTVHTQMPATDAFTRMADMRNYAEWDPGIKEIDQVEGEGGGPDAAYDVTLTGMTLRYVTKRHEPQSTVLLVAESTLLTSEDTITVTPDGKGCRVTYDAVLKLAGPLKLADPLLGLAFNRIGDRAAEGLKDYLDGSFVEAAA